MKFVITFLSLLAISSTSFAVTNPTQPSEKVRVCGLIKSTDDETHYKAIRFKGRLLKLDATTAHLNNEQMETSSEIIGAVGIGQYLCMEGYVDSTATYFSPVD